MTNTLYYGDNLDVLRRHIKDETIDLIYLDPPFNSNATYNILFAEQNGSQAAAQIKAFEDTWRWDQSAAKVYQETVESGGKVAQALLAFRTFLGDSNMLAYLVMMAARLVELHRVLKPTGSLYLHCDPTASHYLKIVLDTIFSTKYFQNEIIWCYETAGKSKKHFSKKHDVILFYSKSNEWIFNYKDISIPRKRGKHMKIGFDENGREYEQKMDRKTGKIYRWYFDEGRLPFDYWIDIQFINREEAQRLGYPTQKPEALLERIIQASSNPGDIVLDPFCGCGTAIASAQKLGRSWIGIDITHLAITLVKHRLIDSFSDGVKFTVIGEPTSLPDAEELARQDPYQFQWWALGLVGARPAEEKKGADKGIDGRLYFHDEAEGGKTKQVIFSVKAGHSNVTHIRDLRGVLDREKAEIGVLITNQEPTQPMKSEAAGSDHYYSPGWDQSYPRIQILTISDLLAGKKINMPPIGQVSVTFKKAPKSLIEKAEQKTFDLKE